MRSSRCTGATCTHDRTGAVARVGGLVFVEQPIDGLLAGEEILQGTGEAHLNARHADIDHDGANDIITPTFVAFQRNGSFPKNQQTPLPSFDGALADIWGSEIYLLQKDRITALRWAKSEWQQTLSQPMSWAAPVMETFPSPKFADNSPRRLSFEDGRFLFDLNGDNKPEIIRVAADGVHVYAKKGLFFEETAVWRVLPPPEVMAFPSKIWPDSDREIELPGQRTLGSIHLENEVVSITRHEYLGQGNKRLTRTEYRIESARSFAVSDAPSRTIHSEVIDSDFREVVLAPGDQIGLLRCEIVGETAPPMPMPFIQTSVSTDGGKTFFRATSLGAVPLRLLTDYNEDGRMDLLSETKRLIEGGIRETLVRGLTRREVDLEVEVRLQEAGKFPSKPTFTGKFTIQLDKPPANQSNMFLRFLSGFLFSLSGDFDGDGIHDAAIQDRPNRIAVHRGSPTSFSSSISASIPIDTDSVFFVADVDGDGRSDVLIGRQNADACSVYFSREAAP